VPGPLFSGYSITELLSQPSPENRASLHTTPIPYCLNYTIEDVLDLSSLASNIDPYDVDDYILLTGTPGGNTLVSWDEDGKWDRTRHSNGCQNVSLDGSVYGVQGPWNNTNSL